MNKILVCLSVVCLSALACLGSAIQAAPLGASAPREAVIVEPTEVLSAPTATVRIGEVWIVCHNANVRPAPAAEDRVLDWKLKGDRVVVLEWVGAWARIGDAMYINGWLLCPQKEASRVR